MRPTRHGPTMVLLAAILWGTDGTAQALGPEGISPEIVALLRMAGCALLVGYALVRRDVVPLHTLVEYGWPLVFAVVAMAGSQPLFFGGVARTGVGVGTIVTIGSGPILADLMAWMVRGECPDQRWAVATGAALAGAVLFVSGGEAAGIDAVGLIFALGAGFAWAVYLVAAKALFESHAPVFVAGVVFAGATVLLAPLALAADAPWLATGPGVLTAAWIGVVTTVLSYVMFSRGLGSTSVSAAATLILAEPLTAAVMRIVLLDEPVRVTTLLGMVLVGLGLVALSLGGKVASQPI